MSGETGGLEAAAEAIWDALDAKHDSAYHVHAAECCWSFPGSLEAIQEAVLDALTEALAAPEVVEAASHGISSPQLPNATSRRYAAAALAAAADVLRAGVMR